MGRKFHRQYRQYGTIQEIADVAEKGGDPMQLFFMMLAYSKARVFTSEDLQTPCMALGALFRMYGEQCSENDSRRSGYITDGHGTNAVAYSVVNQDTITGGKNGLFALLVDQHRPFDTRVRLICAQSSYHTEAHYPPLRTRLVSLFVCGCSFAGTLFLLWDFRPAYWYPIQVV